MFKALNSILDVWKKMRYILTYKQKRQAIGVLFLTILGALAEALGVSVIVPLVQAMVDAEELLNNKYIAPIAQFMRIESGKEIIIYMCIFVCIIYIIKNLYLGFLSYVRAAYASSVKRELAIVMMNAYMKRGYAYFLTVNPQDVLRGVGSDVGSVYEILSNTFKMIAEILTVVCICGFILYVDMSMAGGIILLLGGSLGILILVFRKMMYRIGEKYREVENIKNQHVYESILGIKDVLVFQRENYFLNLFETSYHKAQKYDVKRIVASEIPSYFIEAICITGLIFIVGIKLAFEADVTSFVPKLAAFAVAAFRVLPSIGRISSEINQLTYACPAMNASYENLVEVDTYKRQMEESVQNRVEKEGELVFREKIEIKGIQWHYPNSDKLVLNNLSLDIKKGTSVAFIGQSGAGKSTLADIILGLLYPQEGNVLLDGVSVYTNMKAWRENIGYIPQTVYLLDASIRKNVAYGIPEEEIDDEKVWRAVEQAQLTETINNLPEGLDTRLGDRGIRFSGGQRQRVAIARALYNDPEIIVMDEATAALDNETESAIMETFNALQGRKTLIIIAHRLTTIRNCDKIYEVSEGGVVERNKCELFH